VTLQLTPELTDTPIPTDAPTATPTSTSAPEPAYPAPTLQEPADGDELSGSATFTWQWDGPELTDNHYFDLRIWFEGDANKPKDQRLGAVAPVKDTEVVVNELKNVPAIKARNAIDRGIGTYYWTVVVVEKMPGRKDPIVVGEWGEERKFRYTGPPSGSEPEEEPTTDPGSGNPQPAPRP